MYTGVLGYTGKKLNNDIHWGSSFHKFRSVYRTTNDWGKACKEGIEYFKNNSHVIVKKNKVYLTQALLLTAFIKYEEQYKQEKDTLVPVIDENGDSLVEPRTRFAVPLYIESDIEVLLAGTLDELSYEHGSHFVSAGYRITDCKTSGAYKIREFFDGYRLSTQMLTYRSAIRRYAKQKPGSIWDKVNKAGASCLIEGVFHKSKDPEVEGAGASVSITRSDPLPFVDWQIDEFDGLLDATVKKYVENVRRLKKDGKLPPREGLINDSCDTKFGPCPFTNICTCVDEEQKESMLEEYFTRKDYNPLMFN